MGTYPHDKVYTRLGLSKIQGIGVFAVRDIPRNTNIFENDQLDVFWFDKEKIEKLDIDHELMRYYLDFCILKEGKFGCPVNFNSMTIGWYMNEPQSSTMSNVYADQNYNFFAKRDIKKGEELMVSYSTFSESLKRY